MSSENDKETTFVLFELGEATYAVPSAQVQQLEMVEHITPIPRAPASIAGAVFSRGQVIPAIDLRKRFGLPEVEYDLRTRLIVVRVADRSVGLIVDSAREFKRIAADAIKPPSEMLGTTSGDYLEGIAAEDGRLILVLKLGELIESTAEIEGQIEG